MTVRLALIGLGDIALSAHLPAIRRSTEVTLIAGVDPSPERRRLAEAAMANLPTYPDIDQIPSRYDGAVLATPPWVTAGLIRRLLLTDGRYVLAEKPIADSISAAVRLAELIETEHNRLQVGLTYRHDPAIERLGELIDSDALGAPLLIRAHIYDERLDAADPAHAERIRATLVHGPPVMHEGSHVFDWLRFLLRDQTAEHRPSGDHTAANVEPEVLDAWQSRTDPRYPRPNLIGARLRYPTRGGDAVALVEFGWLTEALPPCQLTVHGQRGYAVLHSPSFRLEVSTAAGTELIEFPGERTARSFDRQLARFVRLITTGGRPSPDLADGLAALRLSARIAELAEISSVDPVGEGN